MCCDPVFVKEGTELIPVTAGDLHVLPTTTGIIILFRAIVDSKFK